MELQRKSDAFLFIADYHALTSVKEPEKLRESTREIAATFLAFGLDPNRQVLFRQSDIPEVAELAWILACNMSAGQLDRGHSVKAARDGGRDINAGVVFYPVLMAADILLYDTNIVPVGKDQKQHLEITRDLAISVNHHLGDGTLVVPEVSIQESVGVVPGLDGRKMSKSYGNTIPLWLPTKKLRKTVMRIVTDSKGVDEPKDPESCNVYALYKLFATPEQVAEMANSYRVGGYGYGHAKQALFEAMEARLAEPRERYMEWMSSPERIEDVLKQGASRARVVADATMARVRKAIGLR